MPRRGQTGGQLRIVAQGRHPGLQTPAGLPPLFSLAQWAALAEQLDLTPQQTAVAKLVCAECNVAEMARRLRRSRGTVVTHLKALYRRMGVRTRVGVLARLVHAERRLRADLREQRRRSLTGADGRDARGQVPAPG